MEIKSCPFCGELPQLFQMPYRQNCEPEEKYAVRCVGHNCSYHPCSPYFDSKEDTINNWNSRKDKWILCSEYMPKERIERDIWGKPRATVSDVVLVTIKSEETDGIHYYIGTDLVRNGKWLNSCFVGGSAILKQEIIAWMPEPDAYIEQ